MGGRNAVPIDRQPGDIEIQTDLAEIDGKGRDKEQADESPGDGKRLGEFAGKKVLRVFDGQIGRGQQAQIKAGLGEQSVADRCWRAEEARPTPANSTTPVVKSGLCANWPSSWARSRFRWEGGSVFVWSSNSSAIAQPRNCSKSRKYENMPTMPR